MAAERARLATQRIKIEAERIAQEEKERAEREAQAERERALVAGQAVAPRPLQPVEKRAEEAPASASSTVAAPPVEPEATDRLGMTPMLEQLRMLGELRDTGYLTDAEFERIKQRILDGEL